MNPASTTLTIAERDQLAVQHVPLVGHLVRETMARVPSYMDRNDLHSAGLLALVQAARAFEPERGVPFAGYASTRIRGALVDELRSVDWASRSVRRRAREIEAARTRLASVLGEFPDDAAVAESLGLRPEDIGRADSEVARAVVVPLDAGPNAGFIEQLAGRGIGPEDAVLREERTQYLAAAIDALPERLQLVVRGYFFAERPMAELAAELGVTESRISQLRAEALVLLRDALAEAFDPHLAVPHPNPDGIAARRRLAYTSAVAASFAARRTLAGSPEREKARTSA